MDEDSQAYDTDLSLPFRIIRIGTLKAFSMGSTRPMIVNSNNMQISISYSARSEKEDVNFVVPCEDITSVQSFLGRGSPAICIQTTEEYNKTFRKALGMKKGRTPSAYYDPDSKVLAERYITIVLACDPVPYSSSHDFRTLMNAIAAKRNISESQFHKPLSIQESNRRLVDISVYCNKLEEFHKLVRENPNSDGTDRLSSDLKDSSSYLVEVQSSRPPSEEILSKKVKNVTDCRIETPPTKQPQPSFAKSLVTPTKNLHRARKSVPKSKHNIDIENQLSEIRAKTLRSIDEMNIDGNDEECIQTALQKHATGCEGESSGVTGPKKTKAKDPMNQIWKTKPKKKTKRPVGSRMSLSHIANSPKIGEALNTPFSTISGTMDPAVDQAKNRGDHLSEDPDIFTVVEKCECLEKNSRLVIKGSVPLKCMAIDCVDGRLSKCIYDVEITMMMRVSQRSPLLALCEEHRERMLRHECCPGCSMFCAGGVYQICVDVEASPHRFHKDCMVLNLRTKNCPHCLAPASKIRDVNIDPGQDHRLRWAVAGLDPNKMEKKRVQSGRVKSARMGHRSIKKRLTEGIVKTLRPGITINTTKLPKGKDRDKLEEALCNYFEARQSHQKLKIHPKNIGNIIQQGDLLKLIQFLSEAEDHDVKNLLRNPSTLSKAVMNSNVAMVFLLGLADVNVNYMDGKGKTALFYAEEKEHVELIDYLINIGANYAIKDNEGMTCMHQAARNGRIVSCAALMAHSRDIVNIPDDGGWMPIVWATEHKHITTARYLEHFGADIMQVDQEGNVCLHWAALSGNLDLIILCLQKQPDINFRNSLGDTALHIATRQDHAECVLCLLNRGSDYTIKNNKGETPLDCAFPDSKSEALLKFKVKAMESMQQSSQSAVGKERTLSADLSKGFENLSVPCVNSIDDAPCPTESAGAFHYVTENVHTTSETIVKNPVNKMQSCYCYNECSDGSCLCGVMSGRCWYNKAGQLVPEFDFVDAPYIVECSETCWCPASCHNRVVQKGIKYRLEVHRTRGMGWSVRALDTIPKGAFVCEYIGELISDAEADIREDDSYLFDLENTDGEIFCIDARYYGNVSRFINHLCDPNLMPLRVFIDHHDKRFPRLAYFSTKEIQAGEELGFDYGDRFWDVKCRSFTCGCGSPKCKYSEEIYRLKNEKEKTLDMAMENSS